MSPASQGNLEVEHYIGSNLISSAARINHSRGTAAKGRKPDNVQKNQKGIVQKTGVVQHRCGGEQLRNGRRSGFPVPGAMPVCGCGSNYGFPARAGPFQGNWTGMQFVPMQPNKPGKKCMGNKATQYQQESRLRNVSAEEEPSFRTPLSRLAIHTQGAPLILSGRCGNANNTNNNVVNVKKNAPRGPPTKNGRADFVIRRTNKYKDNHASGPIDCLSVVSDESSGSGHSENCLPRIIKPRKRRKKDRKPSGSANDAGNEEPVEPVASTSPSYVPDFYEGGRNVAAATTKPRICDSKPNVPKTTHGSQGEEDEQHGPKLHHTFDDVLEGETAPFACSPSSCQCRYCDPSGIWDPAPSESALFTNPPHSHSDLVLRRSWSEPTAQTHQQYPAVWIIDRYYRAPPVRFSREQPQQQDQALGYLTAKSTPNRSNSFSEADSWKVRRMKAVEQWESLKGCDISRPADQKVECPEKVINSNPCLQVSSEIVTSPNGHRDLEIRFFSATPPS